MGMFNNFGDELDEEELKYDSTYPRQRDKDSIWQVIKNYMKHLFNINNDQNNHH